MSTQIKSIVLVLMYSAILIFTPRIFNILENDSIGYIQFADIRTSIYPTIIKILFYVNSDYKILIYFNIILFLSSLFVFLKTSFEEKINYFVILSLYSSLILNIYFNGFHFTILTESISFSLCLLFLTFLIKFIKNFDNKYLIYLSITLSLIFTLRPSSLGFVVVSLVFLFYFCLRNYYKSLKEVVKYLLIPFIIILSIENLLYYHKHNNRNSIVTSNHIYGKALMLDIVNGKIPKINGLTIEKQNFVEKSKIYLDQLEASGEYCLRLERIGDLENYTYFHIKHNKYSDPIKKIIFNFNSFIKLSLNHYLNFFCVATPMSSFDKLKVPFIEKDRFGNDYRLNIIHILFLLLGSTFYCISLYLYLKMLLCFFYNRFIFQIHEILLTYLITACHGFMIGVSVLSISSPRQLMFIYPFIIIIISFFIIKKTKAIFRKFLPRY